MVDFTRQPGCPCCGCIWLYKDWGVTPDPVPATDDPGDSRLALSGGATYDSTAGRVIIPAGGKLRSSEAHPSVEHASVVFRLHLPRRPDLASGYGYGFGGPHIRMFFESDDAEENYQFVDFRYLEYDNISGGWWRADWGHVAAGVETIDHYGFAPPFFNEATPNTWTPWVTLTRATCFDTDLPSGCYEGYRFRVQTGTTATADDPPRLLPELSGGRPFDGIQIERVLSDPAGTHFGIRRLDSTDETVGVSILVAGISKPYEVPFLCIDDFRASRAPCEENVAIHCEPLINNAYAPPVDQTKLVYLGGWDTWVFGFPGYTIQQPNVQPSPPADYNVATWSDIDLSFSIDGQNGVASFNAYLREQVRKYTFNGASYSSTLLAERDIQWVGIELPLDGLDAVACDGFEIELLLADATYVAPFSGPIVLERILWTLQIL